MPKPLYFCYACSMTSSEVDTLAKIVWNYHQLNQPLVKSDAILVLCSIDDRVANFAADLFLRGYGGYIIFSGGVAHGDDALRTKWEGTEADHFADIAVSMGVPKDKILIEDSAQNTGQNITFSFELLAGRGLHPKSLILVQTPYSERRSYATFKKQWPDQSTRICIASPLTRYEAYFNDANPKDLVINIMLGDLQRIKEYPKLNYQIEQDIPAEVWAAYEKLVGLGYSQHIKKY